MNRFILISPRVRQNAIDAIRDAPDGARVTIADRQRSGSQNDKFHAICTDLSASPVKWFGKRRTLDEWKALMVSGHAVATGHAGEVIPGVEGEMVAIRESTSQMGVGRASSLIEYVLAFCDTNGVELRETEAGGFLQREDAA